MTVASTTEMNGYTYAVHKPEPATTPNVCVSCKKIINIGDDLTRLEVVDIDCRENRFPKFHSSCFPTSVASEKPSILDLSDQGEWKVATYGKGNHWVIDPSGLGFQPFSVKEKAEGFVETMNSLNGDQIAKINYFLN